MNTLRWLPRAALVGGTTVLALLAGGCQESVSQGGAALPVPRAEGESVIFPPGSPQLASIVVEQTREQRERRTKSRLARRATCGRLTSGTRPPRQDRSSAR